MIWPCDIRPYQESDENFIYAHWLNALFVHEPWTTMPRGEYLRRQRALISDIMSVHGCRVLVVTATAGEPIYGFICFENQKEDDFLLHFIYIREAWRQKRFASRLLAAAGVKIGQTRVVATAWTKAAKHQKERWRMSFNPFRAWEVLGAKAGNKRV